MWKFQRVYPQRLLRQVLAPPVRVRLRLGSPGVEMHWEEHLGQRHPVLLRQRLVIQRSI